MRRSARLAVFAVATAAATLAAACADNRPFGPTDGGTDATASSDARACASNAACDDNTPCTRDLCLVGGVCEHTPDNTMCTAPMVCVSGRGCTMPGARTCTSPAECDDRIPCTRDTCLVEGTCRNTPDDTMCPTGQACNAASGCGAQTRCTGPADCDDRVACTEDTCGVDGRCVHVPQNMRCAAGQTCNMTMGCVVVSACENNAQCDDRVYCNGMERCSSELACVAGTAVNCDDMDPCTRDACNEAMRACTHEREPSCMGTMVRSGIYNVSPAAMYMCPSPLGGLPLINVNVTSLQFTVTGTMLTITRGPVTMTGSVTGSSFTARGMMAGGCTEDYQITGMFTDATHFSATLTLTLSGGLDCMFCPPPMRSWMFTGTATM